MLQDKCEKEQVQAKRWYEILLQCATKQKNYFLLRSLEFLNKMYDREKQRKCGTNFEFSIQSK